MNEYDQWRAQVVRSGDADMQRAVAMLDAAVGELRLLRESMAIFPDDVVSGAHAERIDAVLRNLDRLAVFALAPS